MSAELAQQVLDAEDRYQLLSVGSDLPITEESDDNAVKKQCKIHHPVLKCVR